MNKTRLIICLTALFTTYLQAQTITRPNYGIKLPETLEISRIVTGPKNTIVYLTLENRIKDDISVPIRISILFTPTGQKVK